MPPTSTTSISHAQLILFDSGKTETPKLGARKKSISFDFNPKELSWNRSANWEAKPSKQPQVPEYTGAAPGSISVEAFLSTPVTKNVEAALLDLFRCVETEKPTASDNPRPPFAQLVWGAFRTGISVVKSVSAKVSLFDADGKPSRATVQLQLQEVPLDPPPQNPTSGGIPGRRVHVMVAGDSLQSVAFAEYDDPKRWRDIAAANAVEDPMRVRPGQRLLIPVTNSLTEDA